MKLTALVLALFIAGATNAFAQNAGSKMNSPHGGMILAAGEYFVEMVKGAEITSFYLLDNKKKTIKNKGVTGTAYFEHLNKTKSNTALTAGSNNAMLVNTPKVSVFVYCTVTLVVKGKTLTAKFRNDALSDTDINHGHQH